MIKMDLLLQGKNKYAQYKILLKFMPIKPCFFLPEEQLKMDLMVELVEYPGLMVVRFTSTVYQAQLMSGTAYKKDRTEVKEVNTEEFKCHAYMLYTIILTISNHLPYLLKVKKCAAL